MQLSILPVRMLVLIAKLAQVAFAILVIKSAQATIQPLLMEDISTRLVPKNVLQVAEATSTIYQILVKLAKVHAMDVQEVLLSAQVV
jgi:hypothetical protein